MKCPECHSENESGKKFCTECGTELSLVCPNCNSRVKLSEKFCGECGQPLCDSVSSEPKLSAQRPEPTPLPSSFADGRYQIQKPIGRGGKKTVYLAHDTILDRDVAFALIETEWLDEASRIRITRESQAMRQLGSHRNIVTVYDLGEENGQPYIVTELMEGDVADLIEEADDHRLPIDQVIDIATAACQGLEFAHARGIIHRDLKPGNIWLTADGVVKISDFGLAQADDHTRLTQTDGIIGTFLYSSPEQAGGGEATVQSDLYSLGAMIYEMVTGRPPFVGDNPVAIIGRHIDTAPVSPAWHRPDLAAGLETLILKLLEKDPKARPNSARAVSQALNSVDPIEVGQWRHERIRPLLGGGLSPASRSLRIHAIAKVPIRWPSGRVATVPVSTLYRWLACYQRNPTPEALCRSPRYNVKRRAIRPEWTQYVLNVFRVNTDCPLSDLAVLVEQHFGLNQRPSVSSLQRSLQQEPLYRRIRERPDGGLTRDEARTWILELLHGAMSLDDVGRQLRQTIEDDELGILCDGVRQGNLRIRNSAAAVLAYLRGIRWETVSDTLKMSRATIARRTQQFRMEGAEALLTPTRTRAKKTEDACYRDALFAILHAPPSDYNINRTTWRQTDLHRIMREKALPIGKSAISKIISDAGYRPRKARTVLTSTDPLYREKLTKITGILSALKPTEKFFSIDEYGPFAVKVQGGLSLVRKGQTKTVPQWQKSKGSLLVTAALELSTNQVTHFYSERKNTAEMIRLLDVLLDQYSNEERIYLSWDAASWHASQDLYERVEEINARSVSSHDRTPLVELAPLPSGAQFLNVIESVFSGMARAIIHNSDYGSVDECKSAIDRHFSERNEHFRRHPKRAGNKIWGKERVPPVFNESNNCKDPQYR